MEQALSVLLCCPNGAGISLMMISLLRQAAQRVGLPLDRLDHCSVREGSRRAIGFDLVFCPLEMASYLKDCPVPVILLTNPLSRREMEDRLRSLLKEESLSPQS